jgi:hypothetical protein
MTNNPGDCASNVCTEFFEDIDGDGYGKGEPTGIGTCGDVPLPLSVGARVRLGGDCCDIQVTGSRGVFPGATVPVTIPDACLANGVTSFNCQ